MNHQLIVLATCAAVAFAACAPTTRPSSTTPPPATTTTPAPSSPPPAPSSPPPASSITAPAATDVMFAQFTKYTPTVRVTDQGGVVYDYKYAGKTDCSAGGDSGGPEAFPVKVEAANQPTSIRYTYTIPKGNCYAGAGVGFFSNDAQTVMDLTAYGKVRVHLASSRSRLAVYIGTCFTEVSVTATLSAYTLDLDAFKGDGCTLAKERSAFNKFQIQDSFVGAEGVTNATIQVGEVSFIK